MLQPFFKVETGDILRARCQQSEARAIQPHTLPSRSVPGAGAALKAMPLNGMGVTMLIGVLQENISSTWAEASMLAAAAQHRDAGEGASSTRLR
jgi:hypothetical protein